MLFREAGLFVHYDPPFHKGHRMQRYRTFLKFTTLTAVVCCLAIFLTSDWGKALAAGAPTPAATPASAPTGGEKAVMANVNGQPIYLSELTDILVRDFGMSIAQQLIAGELVRQEAEKNKITLTDDDLAAENDAVLIKALGGLPPPAQKEKMFEIIKTQLGVPKGIWEMVMRRQALLRKLALPQVMMTEEDIKNEFAAQFGRNVVVRDIQTASMEKAQECLNILESKKPEEIDATFVDLAAKYSFGVTGKQGGLLPPINAKSTSVAPAIREAALSLKKIGQLSGMIQVGTSIHVLCLYQVEEPRNVKFEDVKEKLAAIVRDRMAGDIQTQILQKLITDAQKEGRIEIVNPILRKQQIEKDKAASEPPK